MDDVELIKSRINIVDLISEYLPLKKAGVNFKALCPFHQEKTPSFMVSPERGIWHCFGGCSEGGDIFKFLMKKEGMEFKEALGVLAQKAGVTLKKRSSYQDSKQRFFETNLKAAQFYHHLLTAHPLGKKAFAYLQKRGLNKATIDNFNLGYAPLNWESLNKFLTKRGFSTQEIVGAGLGVVGKSGAYDRFRGRVIFPLIDPQNRIIGFSGRVLGEGEPKYINTPQTAIFDKRRFLYGLNLTKGVIRESKEAIVVEGEIDVILSFQSGVKNIVAAKGTALTLEQLENLKKYTETISLCFDTDLAGDAASRRGIEMADQMGFNIKVIALEGVKDPAEVCLQDHKLWLKMVDEAIPIYDYYLSSATRRYPLKEASSKKAIFAELLPIWKKISDPIVREHYIQKLATYLQVKDEVIRQELGKLKTSLTIATLTDKPSLKAQTKENQEISPDRHQLLEEYLIALILHLPQDSTYIPNFPETLFTQEQLKQIYVLLVLFLDSISFKAKSFKISEFVKTVPDQLLGLVDRLYLTPIDEKLLEARLWQKEIDLVVAELKKMLIKSSLEKLSLQIKNAQEFEKMEILKILNKRFRDLSIKLKNL